MAANWIQAKNIHVLFDRIGVDVVPLQALKKDAKKYHDFLSAWTELSEANSRGATELSCLGKARKNYYEFEEEHFRRLVTGFTLPLSKEDVAELIKFIQKRIEEAVRDETFKTLLQHFDQAATRRRRTRQGQ